MQAAHESFSSNKLLHLTVFKKSKINSYSMKQCTFYNFRFVKFQIIRPLHLKKYTHTQIQL